MSERVHGGIDARELARLRLDACDVVDFSVNLNPYGPCDAVLEAVRRAPLERYPDPHARAARAAWAKVFGRASEELAVGHGASDLFWAIARATCAPGARVLIAEPTFSEFTIAAQACGAEVQRLYARAEHGFRFDLAELARAARGASALYLCSPNNPTGEHVSVSQVRELAQALGRTWLVLDQSFLGLSDHAEEACAELPSNVVQVRSLTKEFACAGLRIGLCVAAAELVARIEAVRPTWSTSSLALAALEACASELAFVRASWLRMRADREATCELLRMRGYAPLPSATAYQLVPLAEEAHVLRADLLRHGVLVRDCASFGLPRHMRVAALPVQARTRFAAALDAVRSA